MKISFGVWLQKAQKDCPDILEIFVISLGYTSDAT